MGLIAVVEADLRAISAEARRRYPAVKDAAEHAILKLRSLSSADAMSKEDDILAIFVMACDTRQTKLAVLGLQCIQKLVAHNAVGPSSLRPILRILKEHSESTDDTVQLKVLQAVLTILQSRLQPEDEESMAVLLGICLRLMGQTRSPDSVHSTASATMRQAVALIFNRVLEEQGLPAASGTRANAHRVWNAKVGDVSRIVSISRLSGSEELAAEEEELLLGSGEAMLGSTATGSMKDMSPAAKLGLRLLEDLQAIAAGQPAVWLQLTSQQRTFALDMVEYVTSHYVIIFKTLLPYETLLRTKVCSLVMNSLRASHEDTEGPTGEAGFRRVMLRLVSSFVRLYHAQLTTECEVFLNMLNKSIHQDLPLWHRILVLEILRGFCVDSSTLHLIFCSFDMRPRNTNIVAEIVSALSSVVLGLQAPDSNEESLAAVAGMFSSKAKGVEWEMDIDWSGTNVVVASEAHAITLAVEGLLGVIFTVSLLTDEAFEDAFAVSASDAYASAQQGPAPSEDGERGARVPSSAPGQGASEAEEEEDEDAWLRSLPLRNRGLAQLCRRMAGSVWKLILDALAIMLSRCNGEAVILEILKGYQAFTQACGLLHLVDPRDEFLASLCRFTLVNVNQPQAPGTPQLEGDRQGSHQDPQQVPVTPKREGVGDGRQEGGGAALGSVSGTPGIAPTGAGAQAGPGLPGTPEKGPVPAPGSGGAPVLTPKNLHALRTLFNIAHRLCRVLGPSWEIVIETLAALDRTIHSPYATSQESASLGQRPTKDSSNALPTEFTVLSALDAQLFQSSATMKEPAVRSLLAALRVVSNRAVEGVVAGLGLSASGTTAAAAAVASASGGIVGGLSGSIAGQGAASLKMFAVERMLAVLSHNSYRLPDLWSAVTVHFLELACHPSPQVRLVAADAVDRAVILGLTCSCGALPNGGALLPAGSLPSQLGRAGALGGAGVGGGGDRGGPGQTWEADLLRVGRQSSLPEPWAEASIGVLEGKYRDPLPGLLEGVPQGDLGEPGSRGLNGGGRGVGGGARDGERDVEAMVVGTVEALFSCAGDSETKAAALRILLHVMERFGDHLSGSWKTVLSLLRLVTSSNDKDLVQLGFQVVQVLLNDCLASVPPSSLRGCVEVAGAYASQTADMNVSLTAIGVLWTTVDFFARSLPVPTKGLEAEAARGPEEGREGRGARPAPSEPPGRSGKGGRGPDFLSISGSGGRGSLAGMGSRPGMARASRSAEDVGDGQGQHPGTPSSSSTAGSLAPEASLAVPPGGTQGALAPDSADLFLEVLKVIQGLGEDDRPEIRNAAIRTLFQSVVTHGTKMSGGMWRAAMWSLIFPLVDAIRHQAARASREECSGRELGKQGGKSVRMLVHHSRNTAQKQWDETLVMALSGMARLLKAFFPYLHTMANFDLGWSGLLQFVEESVLTGNREVALAALALLQTVPLTHASKGLVPRQYWDSVMGVYQVLVRTSVESGAVPASPASAPSAQTKVRQKMLEDLGELYGAAGSSFTEAGYLQLWALLDVMARQPLTASEPQPLAGTLPPVQRTVLDVIPRLQPACPEHVPLWPLVLRQLLAYLPGGERLLCQHCKVPSRFLQATVGLTDGPTYEGQGVSKQGGQGAAGVSSLSLLSFLSPKVEVESETVYSQRIPGGSEPESPQGLGLSGSKAGAPSSTQELLVRFPSTSPGALSSPFRERIVQVALELFMNAPEPAQEAVLPDLVAALGRCMAVRRDTPEVQLWRAGLAVLSDVVKLGLVQDSEVQWVRVDSASAALPGQSGGRGSHKGRAHESYVTEGDPERSRAVQKEQAQEHSDQHQQQQGQGQGQGGGGWGWGSGGISSFFRVASGDADSSDGYTSGVLSDQGWGSGRVQGFEGTWRGPGSASGSSAASSPRGASQDSTRRGMAHGAAERAQASDDGLWAPESSHLREQEELTGMRVLVRGKVRPSRVRMWRELADVFETFLVGACGRALAAEGKKAPPARPASEGAESDEMLEAMALDALCDEALAKCADAPREVQQRLVEVVESCAARTSALSVESAFGLPAHCARFSLSCFTRLFRITGRGGPSDTLASSSISVAREALPRLVKCCARSIRRYVQDVKHVGSPPGMRTDEVILVLKELAALQLHPLVAQSVDVPIAHPPLRPLSSAHPHPNTGSAEVGVVPLGATASLGSAMASPSSQRLLNAQGMQLGWRRAPLFLLYTPLAQLLAVRDRHMVEHVALVFRLIGEELGVYDDQVLDKLCEQKPT